MILIEKKMAKVEFSVHSDTEGYPYESLNEATRKVADHVELFQTTFLCGPDLRERIYDQLWSAVHNLSKEVAYASLSLEEHGCDGDCCVFSDTSYPTTSHM